MIAPAEIVVASWGIRISLNFVTIVLYLRWLLNEGRRVHHSLSRMMTAPAEIVVASWGIRTTLNFVTIVLYLRWLFNHREKSLSDTFLDGKAVSVRI